MMMGRGLLSRSMGNPMMTAGKPGPQMPGPQMPQLGQMGQGMPGAFSGNPQFMAQLQQMMAMKPFTPPPRVGMPQQQAPAVGGPGGVGMAGGMGMGGIDPSMGAGFGMGMRPSMPLGDTSFDMFGARI